jgi:hypothetical protein
MRPMPLLVAVLSTAAVGACGRAPVAVPRVVLDNAVSACLTIEMGPPFRQKNLLLAPAKVGLPQSVAACGCKSALLSVRVTEVDGGEAREMLTAEISSFELPAEDRDRLFVLALDEHVGRKGPVTLHVGCAAPD